MAPGGQIVGIDVDTGDFEVGTSMRGVADAIYARHPNAEIYCLKIGYPAVHRIGSPVHVPAS